jgi:hypothetical protein
MAYITYSEYTTYYGENTMVTEADFPVYANTASDLITSITGYRVTADIIGSLPAFMQDAVKKATAAQVLFFAEHGDVGSVVSGTAGQGFTVGKVSVQSGGQRSSAWASARDMISPMVYVILGPTGLLERGVPCLDRFPTIC